MQSRLTVRTALAATLAIVASLTLSLALAVPALGASSAAAASPTPGVYDCMTSKLWLGGLNGSVKLMAGGRYIFAMNRKGSQLLDMTPGGWRASGNQIRFSGVIDKAGFYAVWHPVGDPYPKPWFSLFFKSNRSAAQIACYRAASVN